MSDIFISYKREEQPEARKLANALEREGWNVWWDPKLRAGDDFDKIIEAVLKLEMRYCSLEREVVSFRLRAS